MSNTAQQQSQQTAAEKTGEASPAQTAQSGSPSWLKGLAVVGLTSGYIFGPMILIGLPGWWLSKQLGHTWIVVIAFLIALVVSNVLIFRNTEKQLKRLSLHK